MKKEPQYKLEQQLDTEEFGPVKIFEVYEPIHNDLNEYIYGLVDLDDDFVGFLPGSDLDNAKPL